MLTKTRVEQRPRRPICIQLFDYAAGESNPFKISDFCWDLLRVDNNVILIRRTVWTIEKKHDELYTQYGLLSAMLSVYTMRPLESCWRFFDQVATDLFSEPYIIQCSAPYYYNLFYDLHEPWVYLNFKHFRNCSSCCKTVIKYMCSRHCGRFITRDNIIVRMLPVVHRFVDIYIYGRYIFSLALWLVTLIDRTTGKGSAFKI